MEDKKKERGFSEGINRRDFLKSSGILLGAASLGSLPAKVFAQDAAAWKYYYYTPPLHHDTATMKAYAQEVGKLTGQKVQITIFPGGELPYPPMEAVNIVRDGFVDGAALVGDFVAGTVPMLNLTNLPMLVTDLPEMEKGMEVFLPYVTREFEKRKIRLLFWHFNSQKCVFGRGKPVEKLEDLKGKKIRTFGIPDSQFMRKLGATPVSMPNTEVPTAMQRGVMDAFIASAFFSVGSRWDELCDWAYLIDMTAIAIYEVAGIPSFKKLPDAHAKILLDVASKYNSRWNREIIELEKKSRAAMAKKGKKMVPISAGDRKEATELIKPYWDEWAKATGPDAAEALQAVRKVLGK
ncbi:MAG: TRAP transporter substrate-binding protein DctP [Pseudomonadota bacterium]